MRNNTTGTVGIEVKGTKLRLRLPRSIALDSHRYISTKWDNTPDNTKRIQVIAWQIETDIKEDRIADTLQSYIDRFKPTQIERQPATPAPPTLVLAELWDLYCDYKKPQLAATTYCKLHKGTWWNYFNKLPQDLSKPVAIRDHLIATVSSDTTKRLLAALSCCCKWAVMSELMLVNPFEGMASGIKTPKNFTNPDPFSVTERDNILAAFQQHESYRYRYHYPLIKFLFLTGCRTGEALALRWSNITPDLSSITFSESYSSKLKIVKGIKTGKPRRFPVNADLRGLLRRLRVDSKTDLVFPNHRGGFINGDRLGYDIWRVGIVNPLVETGGIESYRCLYTTRHTFITMTLAAGLTVSQVAMLVGNSPAVILKHYAGSSVDEVPRI